MKDSWIRGACTVVAVALAVIALVGVEATIIRAPLAIASFIYGIGALYPPFGSYLFSLFFIDF
jgi:hypothetical protein